MDQPEKYNDDINKRIKSNSIFAFLSWALFLTGLALLFWPGITVLFSSSYENHIFEKVIIIISLVISCIGLVMCVISSVLSKKLKRTIGFTKRDKVIYKWYDDSLFFNQGGYAEFTVGDICVYCRKDIHGKCRKETVMDNLPDEATKGAFVGGIVGAGIGAYKGMKEKEKKGIPIGAKGISVHYKICRECMPSFIWVLFLIGISAAFWIIYLFVSASSSDAESSMSDIQNIIWWTPIMVSLAIGIAAARARGFGSPIKILGIRKSIYIEKAEHLHVIPLKKTKSN